MKRMKKKVVAMVTLAMFMMTLLPMAAFAASSADTVTGDGYPEYSTLTVKDSAVEVGEAARVDVTVSTSNNYTPGTVAPVHIWAEDAQGNEVRGMSLNFDSENNYPDSGWQAGSWNKGGQLKDGQQFAIKFDAKGEYTVHAGQLIENSKGEVEMVEFNVDGKIVVSDVVAKVTNITFTPADITFTNDQANGKEKIKVEATVASSNGIPAGTKLTIGNNNPERGIMVVNANNDDITEVEVGRDGKAVFYVKADNSLVDGTYYLNLSCGKVDKDFAVTVPGKAASNVAETLEAVSVDNMITAVDTNKVQFVVKNAAGETLVDPDNEPIFDGDISDSTGVKFAHDNYVKIIKQPDQKYASKKLEEKDLYLKNKDADKTNVELDIRNNKKLVPGEYTIAFTLKNDTTGWVETSFTVGEFDKENIVDLQITADDEIELGKQVNYVVEYVDKNGLTQATTNYNAGYTPAVEGLTVTNNAKGAFTVKYDADKKDVLGTKVAVTVATTNKPKLSDTKEFTIVDKTHSLLDNKIVFDSTEGKVLTENRPGVIVENKFGEVQTITNLFVKKIDQSNKDAKVNVSAAKGDGTNSVIKIYSDKATTVDVQVLAWVGDAVYADTLKYSVGEKELVDTESTTVVMTLGSTEMIINNKVVDMKDAAPFAQDNRTFVPFRALGEKVLGATVEYDKDTKTVTYELDGNKIVMTLDSKTYTVNGAEKTMDVAPFAKDNRTYVPVRFVGEALGFTVTGLTNGAGQYVGVAFTK